MAAACALLFSAAASAETSGQTYYAKAAAANACAISLDANASVDRRVVRSCERSLSDSRLNRPSRAKATMNAGIARLRAGDSARALQHFEDASQLGADESFIRVNKAAALLAMDDPQGALRSLSDIDTIDPRLRERALFNSAMAHWDLGDHTQAYLDLKAAEVIAPSDQAIQAALSNFNVVNSKGG